MAAPKHVQSTHFFIPTSFCFFNFAQESILWVVLALVLAVFGHGAGPGLGPDSPGGQKTP